MSDDNCVITILNYKTCKFTTNSNVILKKIKTLLSFRAVGVEYTPAYKNGWDGITYLINKNRIFRIGLLNIVKNYLIEQNIPFVEKDLRVASKPATSIDLSERLQEMKLIPRYYQNDILKSMISNERGIIRACTGAGKTLSIAMAVAKFNRPTMVYVIGLDLLNQFHELLSSLFSEEIGYIGNGVCDVKRINVASVWTIASALKIDAIHDLKSTEGKLSHEHYAEVINALDISKIHIFDESHIAATSTISQIYNNINPERIYGFSGTPYRGDNSDILINSILGDKIIDINASQLIDDGFLTKPIIKFVKVPKMKGSFSKKTYQEIYKECIVENKVRNSLIVDSIKDLLDKEYVPLVLFKQIKHGDIIFSLLKEEGINCEKLSGTDSLERREEVKTRLKNKEIDVILASTIFDIGIDLPILSGLVLCGGGKSPIRALQRIGRILRKFPDKQHAAVVDFIDPVKFLKNHTMARKHIYMSEKGFDVKWPKT